MSPCRINLRRFRCEDVDAVYEAVCESHAQISRWMAWLSEDYTRESAEHWIAAGPQAWEDGERYDFAVVDADDRFLGAVGLNAVDRPTQRANLGYWVRTSAAGRGIATAAGRLLIELAFAEPPVLPVRLHRLEIVVAVGNEASHRVAKKLGAVREGLLRDRLRPQGRPQHAVLYSVLRTDRQPGVAGNQRRTAG